MGQRYVFWGLQIGYYKNQLSLTNPARRDRAQLTTLRVESRQVSATLAAFNLSHLHLAHPVG